jgi:8-oxo-dGTP diphosphatase
MDSYNLIMVLNKEETKVLMCLRSKNPYKGLYNLVGGKIDEGEDDLDSAYRELFEETGIDQTSIKLLPFIDFTWHTVNMEMKVFIGRINKEVKLIEEIHRLYWLSIDENFFDMTKFAGEGNIGHMIEIYKQQKNDLDFETKE